MNTKCDHHAILCKTYVNLLSMISLFVNLVVGVIISMTIMA